MKIFGSVALAIEDFGNELQFRITREDGWFERFAGPIAAAAFLFFAWRQQSVWYLAFGVIAIVALIINWLQGRETTLSITSGELIAEGNLGRMFMTSLRLPFSDVDRIDWSPGAEGDPGGLFMKSGFTSSWVLPGITQEQAQTVLGAISGRFPDLPVSDNTPASLLFGRSSGITTLGLNNTDSDDSHAKRQPLR